MDVDIDTDRLRSELERAGDTIEARRCVKDTRAILREANEVRKGVVRYSVAYVHGDL